MLVFSAKGQPEEVERALNLGAAGYFVKATSKPEKVVEKIRLILSQKLKSQEVTRYSLEIRNDTYDAVKLASDFSLNGLKCPNCQQPMLLELIPDFSHETAMVLPENFTVPRVRVDPCNRGYVRKLLTSFISSWVWIGLGR